MVVISAIRFTQQAVVEEQVLNIIVIRERVGTSFKEIRLVIIIKRVQIIYKIIIKRMLTLPAVQQQEIKLIHYLNFNNNLKYLCNQIVPQLKITLLF